MLPEDLGRLGGLTAEASGPTRRPTGAAGGPQAALLRALNALYPGEGGP